MSHATLSSSGLSQKRGDKETSIETLRGLACVLIVAYHSISAGLAADGLLGYGYLAHCFRLIRLPLFVAISGYVYAKYPIELGALGQFLAGKARRILLPWVSVTLLTLGLRALLTRGWGDLSAAGILQAFWLPIDHLWFLPAIFWVVLTVAILERNRWLSSFRHWLLACMVAWVPAVFFMVFPAMAITGYFQLLPFFLFGLGLFRFQTQIFTSFAIWIYIMSATIGLLIHQLMWFGMVKLNSYQYNLMVLVTVYGTQGLIFRYRKAIQPLAWLGHYSFAIFLFHLIAISVAVRLANAAFVNNVHLVFALKLGLGLTLPIAAMVVIQRSKLLSLALLGERRS